LKIPYRVFPDLNHSSGSHLYVAVAQVQIALPIADAPRSKRFEAIIDSGATRTLFHADLASNLGLDLKSGAVELTHGIGAREATYLHDISLYVPGGAVTIKAGFKERLPIAGLLGMNGFFEFFKITFDPDAKACELQRIYRV
jgi:hypothetical protein